MPRDWTIDAFTAAKPMVIESPQMARSKITVSFDHLLADNELGLLGDIARCPDSSLDLKTALLTLKPSCGYNAWELQDTLLPILREYKISNKIGYFLADNAANNDADLRPQSHHIDLKPAKHRLRCSGCVINWSSKLYYMVLTANVCSTPLSRSQIMAGGR